MSDTTPRPVRALTHDASKAYALKARSRSLSAEDNAILKAAGEGQEVDVFDFRAAATQALSLAATRAGQSMARRQWTKEARHLIHWADSILANHLDGLPVYAEGDRSRLVETLKADVESATNAANSVKAELDAATEHVGVQNARIAALISEKTNAQLDAEQAKHAALRAISTAEEAARVATARVDRRVFNYALGLLSLDDQLRVAGYADGVNGESAPTAKF